MDKIMVDPTELRRLTEAATPGPWETFAGDSVKSADVYDIAMCDEASTVYGADGLTRHQCDANAAYIAAMHPETTRALLDRLAELEDKIARMDEMRRISQERGDG